jgi:hypothetical protein
MSNTFSPSSTSAFHSGVSMDARKASSSSHQPQEYPSNSVSSSDTPLSVGRGPVTWFWTYRSMPGVFTHSGACTSAQCRLASAFSIPWGKRAIHATLYISYSSLAWRL